MPLDRIIEHPATQQVAAIGRWWLTELRDIARMLPTKRARSASIRIILGAQQTIVERLNGEGAERFVDKRAIEDLGEEGFAELRDLIGIDPVAVYLQAPDTYTAKLNLPRAVKPHLQKAVALALYEYAPLKPEYLSWAIIASPIVGEQVHVSVVMAKIARLEQLQQLFEERGIRVKGFYFDAGGEDVALPFARVMGESEEPGRYRSFLICALLIGSIPLTTLAASAVLTARANNAAEKLRDKALDVRAAERAARRLETQKALLSPLAEQASAAAVLNGIAKALPPTDWLHSIERQPNGSVNMIVSSADEDALDKGLRGAEVLKEVHVVDRSSGGEARVDVTYEADIR